MTDALRQRAHLRVVQGALADQANRPGQPLTAAWPALDAREPFDVLYRRYAPYVASIAVRLIGRDTELDDLVQDVFIEVLRGLDKLREPAAFKGWLAQITVRTAMRRLRQRNLRRALHLPDVPADYEALSNDTATPEQRALVAHVYRVLDRLPARTRVIWIVRNVLGEPLHHVAELVDCSLSTVQRRLLEAQALIDREVGHG
ncbi:MAG: sigma-70 family RNA polymerase sigma factor [Polyangiales bacterium]